MKQAAHALPDCSTVPTVSACAAIEATRYGDNVLYIVSVLQPCLMSSWQQHML